MGDSMEAGLKYVLELNNCIRTVQLGLKIEISLYHPL